MKPEDTPSKTARSSGKLNAKGLKKISHKKLKDDSKVTTQKSKGDKAKGRGKKNKNQDKTGEPAEVEISTQVKTEEKLEDSELVQAEEWHEHASAAAVEAVEVGIKKAQNEEALLSNSNVSEKEEGATTQKKEKIEEETEVGIKELSKNQHITQDVNAEQEETGVQNEATVENELEKKMEKEQSNSEKSEPITEKSIEEDAKESANKEEQKENIGENKSKLSTEVKEVAKEKELTKIMNEKKQSKTDDILISKDIRRLSIKKLISHRDINLKKTLSKRKLDMKSFINDYNLNTPEKEVFEYVPDNCNYAICHNDPNELYTDVVGMNKHFIDEMNFNLYASPLNAYLSSVLEESQNATLNKTKKIAINNATPLKKKTENESSDKLEKEIDGTSKEPKCAYEYFKNKVFKCYDNGVLIEVDPSQLKYNDSTEYEYSQNLTTYKTDPLAYLNKLKCEIEDITQYIKNLTHMEEPASSYPEEQIANATKNKTRQNKIIKQILHNREVPELLLELHSLERDVNSILTDEKIQKMLTQENKKDSDLNKKESLPFSDETHLDNLFKIIDTMKENELHQKAEPSKQSTVDTNAMKSFNIYTLGNEMKEEPKEVQVNDLLVLERKITELEKFLGVDKMALLPYEDMNQAIIDLYHKLNLLDPNKLENVKKKVQNLQSEFANLKKSKREILNIAKDRNNYEESIDELYTMLDIWKKTHHVLPNILTRLHQLKSVHDNAQLFASRLNDLELQQSKLNETLNTAEGNIKLLNGKLDENVTFLQETLKKIENAVLTKGTV